MYAIMEDEKGFFALRDIQKAKEPLFTTEDGKDIYEGKEYWSLNTETWQRTVWKAYREDCRTKDSPYKFFSTEEAAKQYVLLHKKELSLLDAHEVLLAKLMSSWEHDIAIEYYRKLKLLVEKKINDNTL
jgi:hypothetical protein